MTYYGARELAASFRTVRNNTIKIAEEIPEDQYGFRATPDTRSIAELLAHIAIGPRLAEQVQFAERRTTMAGFDFFGFMARVTEHEKQPRTKAQLLDMLRTEGEKFAKLLESAPEDFLAESVQYPPGMVPESKSRFEMLLGVKEHEMHHRANLMLAQRMLGMTPPLTRQMQERIASMRAAQAGA